MGSEAVRSNTEEIRLDSSIKSSKELEGQLEIARDYGVLQLRQWTALAAETVEIRRMTCGLRSKVLRKSPPPE